MLVWHLQGMILQFRDYFQKKTEILAGGAFVQYIIALIKCKGMLEQKTILSPENNEFLRKNESEHDSEHIILLYK